MRSLSPLQSQARELSYRKAAVLVLLQASLPSFVRPTTLNTINNSICFPYFSYYVRTLPHLVISSHLNCKWLPRRRTKPIIAEIVSSSSPNKNHPAVLLRPPNLLASRAASLTLSSSDSHHLRTHIGRDLVTGTSTFEKCVVMCVLSRS